MVYASFLLTRKMVMMTTTTMMVMMTTTTMMVMMILFQIQSTVNRVIARLSLKQIGYTVTDE
jgi:hypothetical protein